MAHSPTPPLMQFSVPLGHHRSPAIGHHAGREAQAQHRIMSQLRTCPTMSCKTLAWRKSDLTRLRNGRPPAIFHAG